MGPKNKFTIKLNSPPSLQEKSLKNLLGTKKINREITHQKYTTKTMKFGTIFGKSRRNIVILKIIGATSQLDQILKPIKNLPGQFFYIHISIYMSIVFNIS